MVGSEAPKTLDFEFIATNLRSSRQLNNFSSLVPEKIYREQYGEYTC